MQVRNVFRRKAAYQADGPDREQKSRHTTGQRQRRTFGQQQFGQAPAPSTERTANRHFLFARGCAGEMEIGHVGTGDQ